MTGKVTPVGVSGFSVTTEARGFKNSEEKKKYSQTLILSKEDADKLIKDNEADVDKLLASEIEKAKKHGKPTKFLNAGINMTELDDGRVSFNFSRKEELGPPTVIDKDNQPFTGYVPRGGSIQVGYTLRSYVMDKVFKVSLILEAVKVLNSSSKVDVNKLFGAAEPKAKESASDLF